jgi:hypothetical protein
MRIFRGTVLLALTLLALLPLMIGCVRWLSMASEDQDGSILDLGHYPSAEKSIFDWRGKPDRSLSDRSLPDYRIKDVTLLKDTKCTIPTNGSCSEKSNPNGCSTTINYPTYTKTIDCVLQAGGSYKCDCSAVGSTISCHLGMSFTYSITKPPFCAVCTYVYCDLSCC